MWGNVQIIPIPSRIWEYFGFYSFFHHHGDHIFPQSPKLLGNVHSSAYTLSTSDCLLLLYTYAGELVMLHTLQDKRDHLDATFFTFLWDQHFVLFDNIELRAPSQKITNFSVLCIMQAFL